MFDTEATFGNLAKFPKLEWLETPGRIIFRRTPQRGTRFGEFRDVREFFNSSRGHKGPWGPAELFAASLRGEKGAKAQESVSNKCKLYVKGDSVHIYTEIGADPAKANRRLTVYDGNVGFNVVRHYNITRDSFAEVKMTYRAIAGIFVPETCERLQSGVADGKKYPQTVERFALLGSEVNEPIEGSEFAMASHGVRYAERMVDEIEDKVYAFDDKQGFVPMESFVVDTSRINLIKQAGLPENKLVAPAHDQRTRWWLLAINAVIVIAVVGAYLVRRRLRSAKLD
jgi:hypothetical protein